MLLARNFVPLAVQHFGQASHSAADIPRLNHCIDIAALGGNLGIVELFLGIGGTGSRP
jgi:hypothetical protein